MRILRLPHYCTLLQLILSSTQIATNVSAQQSFSCPNNVEGFCITIPHNTNIILSKSSFTGELLTLTRVDSEKDVIPVGRSYNGYDWETVAGPYDTLKYECNMGEDFCHVHVPEATSAEQVFQLSRFTHELSIKDNIARLLEQGTFGTTTEDLNRLLDAVENGNHLNETLTSWVHEQIYEIEATLHRAFFRRRVAPNYFDRTPSREGEMVDPCSTGTRWRNIAFSDRDLQKDLQITKSGQRFVLAIDGQNRAMIDDILFTDEEIFEYSGPSSHRICAFNMELGIRYTNKCRRLAIPDVDIHGMVPQPQYILETSNTDSFAIKFEDNDNQGEIEYMVATKEVISEHPEFCNMPFDYVTPIFLKVPSGQVLMYDSMLKLDTNTLESPLPHGGAITVISSGDSSQCANVARTYLNSEDCKLSSEATCSSNTALDLTLHLNPDNLREIYKRTGRYYYVAQGLRLGESEDEEFLDFPCSENAKSRWIEISINDCPEQNIRDDTAGKLSSFDAMKYILRKQYAYLLNIHDYLYTVEFSSLFQSDANPHMKDVYFPKGSKCNKQDNTKMEMIFRLAGKCWKNIHPHQLNVFDFTFWASNEMGSHPGNSSTRNPIEEFASAGKHYLTFPPWHAMRRWYDNKPTNLRWVGRFGDHVDYIDLPDALKEDTDIIFDLFSNKNTHSISQNSISSGITCGSPGEVSNIEVQFLNTFDEINRSDKSKPNQWHRSAYFKQRKQVWTEVVLNGRDQLRQRVSWCVWLLFFRSINIHK